MVTSLDPTVQDVLDWLDAWDNEDVPDRAPEDWLSSLRVLAAEVCRLRESRDEDIREAIEEHEQNRAWDEDAVPN